MKRRLALISEHASPFGVLGGVDSGGQNVYVGQLAKHLAAMGYTVDVFTRRDHTLLPEIADWVDGVRLIHVPAGPATHVRKEDLLPFMADFTGYVLQFCKRQTVTYDLIHANFWMSGLVAADVKRQLGIPFVMTFHALGRVRRLHQGKADEFPDERFAIEDRIAAEADAIIAECPQDEEDLCQLYHADPSKIVIIPCGFNPTEFEPLSKPLARVALGLPANERVLLQLGRMVPRKGIDTVIRSLAHLVQDYQTPAHLIVVGGDGNDFDSRITAEVSRLKAIAAEVGISDRVIFMGRQRREMLKYYYSAADVFITTPWYEPFGITPIEAMACGTPVIGANVGGIKFTVRDGETGYLVPPNEPVAIAERLAYLYQQPELLSTFRQQAIKRANALFTWQTVTTAIARLYERVVAENQPEQRSTINALALIDRRFEGALTALQTSRQQLQDSILSAAAMLSDCFQQGGKVLLCGNGGSAADAQHCAAEFVGRFRCGDRPGFPAMALTADSAVLTAWANDMGYDNVFARQVESFGKAGDVLIGISTSGRSQNVVQAFTVARSLGMQTLAILGGDGGELRLLADHCLLVPSSEPQHIQEVQIVIIHLLCELVEQWFVAPSSVVSRQPLANHLQAIERQLGKAIAPDGKAIAPDQFPAPIG
ncbi:glycosyltransferase [Phormidium sp. FACHB-592]|uniref:Phosphoheptose isomerase n=1 Tax=Stenomitos frigidus AS-A4 TaxID=2933935 RepID=A0ABV0KGT5_9CYAN|nr:glycosyltransferase [Phormidium sp. FACHB-592]MBD2076149.1 glycosyltransferase [Phormidium sp. FACHB-592]